MTTPLACDAVMRVSREISRCCILLVYLGFLEFAAEVGVDYFPFGEDVKACESGFAVAVASAAGAPEGELDFGSGGARVDVEDAGGDVTHGTLGIVDVLSVDGTGEAVLCVVVYGDGIVE